MSQFIILFIILFYIDSSDELNIEFLKVLSILLTAYRERLISDMLNYV